MTKDSWDPNQYEKFKNERSQPFFDLVELIRGERFPRIIDLGCGSGELTEVLHRRMKARETVGIDNSPNMLAKAKAIQAAGLSFGETDIDKMEAFGKFDLIFSNAALQWCADHEGLFRKIRGQLNPGGR